MYVDFDQKLLSMSYELHMQSKLKYPEWDNANIYTCAIMEYMMNRTEAPLDYDAHTKTFSGIRSNMITMEKEENILIPVGAAEIIENYKQNDPAFTQDTQKQAAWGFMELCVGHGAQRQMKFDNDFAKECPQCADIRDRRPGTLPPPMLMSSFGENLIGIAEEIRAKGGDHGVVPGLIWMYDRIITGRLKRGIRDGMN